MERANPGEELAEKDLIRKIKGIDKNRVSTYEMAGRGTGGDRVNYHLTVNTSDWNIKDLAVAVKDYYVAYLERTN